MTELGPLVLRHLREMTRGRLARATVVLFAVGMALAAWLGSGSEQAAGLMLLSSMLVLTLFVTGAALGAAGALPEDRAAGREEWLATLAPAAPARRLSAALAGWFFALALGVAGGAVAGVLVAVLRPDAAPRASYPVGSFDGVILSKDDPSPWTVTTRAGWRESPRTLEVDVRPRFGSMDVPIDRVEIAWRATHVVESAGHVIASVRGPIRLDMGGKWNSVELELLTPGVALRVGDVRVLGEPASPIFALTLAGLLVGLLVGCVAPVAVFISRGTTGQTAAAAACCLLFYGAVKGALLTFAGDLDLGGAGSVAAAVLRGVGWLAPDAPLLGVFAETAAQRTLAGLSIAGPALLYGAAGLVLVALPSPRRFTEGVNG